MNEHSVLEALGKYIVNNTVVVTACCVQTLMEIQ